MASRRSSGTLRTGRRGLDHPHVAELERALPGTSIASFTPTIAYAQPRGLLVVISGAHGGAEPSPSGEPIDVESVLHTPNIVWRLTTTAAGFTLSVVADNLTAPAANAIALARYTSP